MNIKDGQINVTQTVGGDNHGNIIVAKGNVNAISDVNKGDKEDIESIIKYLKTAIMSQDVESDEKEIVLDDLDTIEEQINCDNPKNIKIKKAYEGIKRFVRDLPNTLSKGALIVTKTEELYSKLKPFFEN